VVRRPALDLLKLVLSEHDIDRNTPRVVPCLHEDLATDRDFLRAAAARFDGVLYDLDADPTDWDDPAGPVHASRAAFLRGLAGSIPGALPGALIIDVIDDHVVAHIDGHPGPPETSLLPILRAAAVIASDDYDTVDITWLCADIDTADPARATLLWTLLTANPVDLKLTGHKTIVPVLGRRVEPSIDYLREPAVRLVARRDRVLRRTPSTLASAMREIADHGRPLVLFLGAGASASSGIRLGNVYRDRALRELLGESVPVGATDLADRFFDYLHDQRRFLPGEGEARTAFVQQLTLERVLRETFHEQGTKPRESSSTVQELIKESAGALGYMRPGRQAIHDLATTLKNRLVIMTVNFDELIETDMPAEHLVCATPEDFGNSLARVQAYLRGEDEPVPILKLHGTISDPASLIGSIDDTAAGLRDEVRSMLDAILAFAQPMTWVWVGCSMRDRDINSWLGGLGRRALDEWWVDPLPGESLDQFIEQHRRAAWDTDGHRRLTDRLVIDSADSFLGHLSTHCS
jgi:hypothetical protein